MKTRMTTDNRTANEAAELERINGKRIEETTLNACRIFLRMGDATPANGKGR